MTTKDARKQIKKEEEQSLEKLVADAQGSRYGLVHITSLWAKHLKRQEEYRNAPISKILDEALKEILTEKVSWEHVREIAEKEAAVQEKPGKTKTG
ncbi:MAG: hypothetical protein ABIG11_03420 [bacterium]